MGFTTPEKDHNLISFDIVQLFYTVGLCITLNYTQFNTVSDCIVKNKKFGGGGGNYGLR